MQVVYTLKDLFVIFSQNRQLRCQNIKILIYEILGHKVCDLKTGCRNMQEIKRKLYVLCVTKN